MAGIARERRPQRRDSAATQQANVEIEGIPLNAGRTHVCSRDRVHVNSSRTQHVFCQQVPPVARTLSTAGTAAADASRTSRSNWSAMVLLVIAEMSFRW